MNQEVMAMAQRAHDEGNIAHLKNIRDSLDYLYEKVPTREVMRLLRDVDKLLCALRRERVEARRG